MKIQLLTIQEYQKKTKIQETTIRKQIQKGKLETIKYNDKIHIIIEDFQDEKQNNKIKLLNKTILSLKNEIKSNQRTEQNLNEYKERIEKLENRIMYLEERLDKQIEQKENLYEKFISSVLQIEKPS